MKTSLNCGLINSELNFCICPSFSPVTMVQRLQMYRVYYRIVFKRLRQHLLTTKFVIGALLAYADKGMMAKGDMTLEGIIRVELIRESTLAKTLKI